MWHYGIVETGHMSGGRAFTTKYKATAVTAPGGQEAQEEGTAAATATNALATGFQIYIRVLANDPEANARVLDQPVAVESLLRWA
jgi:hypothetical protein